MKAHTKRTRKKKSFRSRLFFLLFILLLAGIAIYYVLSLPIWKIQEVSVDGAKILSADEIREISSVPLSENLFLSSFARVRNNLKKISAIQDFHIYRIPPGTVLIRIQERKPIAVIVLKDKSAVVDAEGYILNRNPNLTLNIPNMTDLPVIAGIGTAEVLGGEKITPNLSGLIADIILELSSSLGLHRIQLELGGFQKIVLVLDDILRVKVGRDQEVKEKMAVFARLLPVIANRWAEVEYVDVRYPNNPAIKYR